MKEVLEIIVKVTNDNDTVRINFSLNGESQLSGNDLSDFLKFLETINQKLVAQLQQ